MTREHDVKDGEGECNRELPWKGQHLPGVTTPFSFMHTASFTAIWSKWFVPITTLAISTPALSDVTRTFTL